MSEPSETVTPLRKNERVASPGIAIGWDFGFCAPGKEFVYVSIHLHDGETFRHVLDAYIDPRHILRIGGGEVAGAQ